MPLKLTIPPPDDWPPDAYIRSGPGPVMDPGEKDPT